ncbi:MAG: CRISPR-associated protein Cas4 [Candidatus Parvarchaeota archaeon]|nr:CRISPR-associated protein Cas4 [Candidatus Jingweiarchaeum tengchongense]MCW1300465.1 CRISPR-associated protein Cas4 [Candidatus Jingweiarchaeum tengchongense]MCW1304945.1 CRISPR-associated protein Cas4 [Candidatus Jingweiarchaeum tengchongense]MCW1305495.1 CRISPR-associated protein Cas4 [Candidatus Jingweiarchaeum tengchongense]MCW1309981.1 CRISPR-associated protein Cas4 [Candidatus Jingweiarchaeum tengchongense]
MKVKASWLTIWACCQYQFHLHLKYGPMFTSRMLEGKKRHEKLYSDFLKDAVELPEGTDIMKYSLKNTFYTREIFLECDELVGRLDGLFVDNGLFIPIEDKFTRAGNGGPFYHHVLQLWAYCFIIEKKKGEVDYGLIRYIDNVFKVKYDEKARSTVAKAIKQINLFLKGKIAPDDLEVSRDATYCKYCAYNSLCDRKLG